MKTSGPKTIEGVTYYRTQIGRVKVGDRLYQMPSGPDRTPATLGLVVEICEAANRVARCTLDNGTNLTYRGWASKRIWKIAD